jgi:hypothetical protein
LFVVDVPRALLAAFWEGKSFGAGVGGFPGISSSAVSAVAEDSGGSGQQKAVSQ